MQAIENKILNQISCGISAMTNFEGNNLFSENIFFQNTANFFTNDFLKREEFFSTNIHKRDLYSNFLKNDAMTISEWNVIFREHCSESLLCEFEREFEDRLASLNKDLPKKLKSKGLFNRLFSMWMVSLCSLVSMSNGKSDEQEGLFGMSLFE